MAAYIPNEIIDEINQRVDILDLVGRYVRLRRTGRNYIGLCPFHNEDSPSFTVTPDKQIYYCFGCNKGGGPINFLMEIENLSFPDAVRKLAAELNIVIPEKPLSPAQERARQERVQVLNMHKLAADFYAAKLRDRSISAAAIEYMSHRDIPVEFAAKFGLGYAPDSDWEALCRFLLDKGYAPELIEKAGLGGRSAKSGKMYDKFHSRLIFPIYDFKGQVVAFGGRIIGNDQPKYINSTDTPIYNKSNNLYGINFAGQNIRKYDQAIIMEGYMDVLMAHRYGVDNAVASLGTALTPEQAQLLHRYTEHALLVYDGDAAGQKASLRGIEILRAANFDIKLLTLPNGMDPDDFLKKEGKEAWDHYVERNAVGALEFLLNAACSKYDTVTVNGKSRIVSELLNPIARTKSVVERDSFIRLMSDRLGVLPESIYADLRNSGLKIASPAPKKAGAAAIEVKLTGSTAPLFRLAITDRRIFERAEEMLGTDFWESEQEQAIADIIRNDKENYDWQPVGLLQRIGQNTGDLPENVNASDADKELISPNSAENKGIKQFLLKLLSKESPEDNAMVLAEEYICGIRIRRLQSEIDMLLHRIQKGEADPELLQQLMAKQKDMQALRRTGN